MKKKLVCLLALCFTLSLCTLPASALELEDARQLLREHYVDEIPDSILALDSLDEILSALNDPYTVYYTAEQYKSFLTSVNGDTVVGIGVSIQNVFQDGYRILSALPDSPALEAGIEAGDRIIAVDGITLTATHSLTALLSGEEGTNVTVTILRTDGTQKDFTLTRRAVAIPIVTYEQQGSIGFIDCTSFGSSTSDVVEEALLTMEKDISVWVMDLRSNSGGIAKAAAATAGHFAGDQSMMHLWNSSGYSNQYYTINYPDLTEKPLILLTGSGSASGAESFASCARDHEFGIAVGQRTFGKGVAQTVYDQNTHEELFDGDAFKITAYRFYSPDDTTNHIVGILPTLLVSKENTEAVARLLSSPEPQQRASRYWKLELADQTFYIERETALAEENLPAFTELLEALPPSAKLYQGYKAQMWERITLDTLIAEAELDCSLRTFTDITDSPFAREIETLSVYKLLSGYDDGTFRPTQTLTRAQFSAMIATALNLPKGSGTSPFSDVSGQTWYAPFISAMTARGFLAGYEDGTFRPDAPITCQEIVTVLNAVAAWANTDAYERSQEELYLSDWARYIDWADWAQIPARDLTELGLDLSGLTPSAPAQRQQAAGLLCRMMEALHLLWN